MDAENNKFIYCLKEIKLRYKELTKAIRNSKIYYSLKSNNNASILEYLVSLGLEAEVSSPGELDAAIGSGFNTSNIVYGGPGKTVDEIYYAAEKGVTYFSLESLTELSRLDAVEGLLQLKLKRIIRLFVANNKGRLNMMMPNSKFGITINELISYITKSKKIIYGIHIYNGTQINESDFRNSIHQTNKAVLDVERAIGYKLKYVNYGGGLEWPYMKSGTKIITGEKITGIMENIEACFEFGRYLVASSGTLEMAVLDVKERNDQQVLIVSAGVNIINGISASGRLINQKPDFNIVKCQSSARLIPTAIYGPLCTPVDYMTLDTSLPSMQPGDVLSIPNCGAYAQNTGLTNFLLRKPAKEIIIE
ncbi:MULTISPECIES: hypothetical protein [unclassified Brenneria]|uniref:hypothetical protein n=1 Tax=unclassified Brenneria TaxID=2634434 RepID=UPI0018F0609F|nr:hypothetical protein [Brenneria sp. L3-3C-1]MBJ7224148.1 hypothetical protein [Brenneria sp. L3-3C-1]MEE3645394.1 hypothetical protein [Brenneria sp. L3_3C_1]